MFGGRRRRINLFTSPDGSLNNMSTKQGFTDAELQGTYLAMIACKMDTTMLRVVVDKKHYNDDKQVFQGATFEIEPHITIGLKLKAPSAELIEKIGEMKMFDVNIAGVDRLCTRKKKFDDGSEHNYDVIILQVEISKQLLDLQSILLNDSKVVWPYDQFKAHITLAYVKPLTEEEWLAYSIALHSLLKHYNMRMRVQEITVRKFRDRSAEAEKRIKLRE